MGLREEKKQELRQAILDTALALFRERGYGQTRVQDVTARLRISEGTFFNYFPSKQSVLEAAALEIIERATELLHRDAVDDDRPPAERLEECVRAWATNFAGDREFATLLATHTQLFLGRWSEEQWQERVYRPLTLLLEDGQRRGQVRRDIPAGQLAELYLATNLTTVSNWVMHPPGGDSLDERLLRAWSVFRDGALPGAAGAAARPRAASSARRRSRPAALR
ncbi:MAG: TetR/AcrR family transcriptional regulator [Acidimicrobiia bacterium]